MKESYYKSKTSDDTDIKLGPVTKLGKRKKTKSKKFDDDVIVVFTIYVYIGAIWKLDFRHIICKICIFINGNPLSYQN